jgi:hypothetical protein
VRADILVVLGVLLLASRLLRGVRTRDWFNPLVLPTAYVLLTLTVPFIFVSWTGRWLGDFGPAAISGSLVSICAIAFLSLWAGIVLGSRHGTSNRIQGTTEGEFTPYFARVRAFGLVLLAVLTPVAVWLVVVSTWAPYGYEQLTYGLSSSLKAVLGVIALPAVALVGVGGVGLSGKVPRRDWVAIVGLLALLFAAGNRSVPLSILLFLAFLRHEAVRRIRLTSVVAGAVGIVLLMIAVVLWRGASPLADSPIALVEPAVESVASPVGITARLLEIVPGEVDYFMGSTYGAAVKYLLPGPIARGLLGGPSATGSFAYRDLIGFTDTSQGLGFSMMAEAYLNFGPVGVAAAFAMFGVLLAWAWKRSRPWARRARDLLYPILLAQVPYILRSDALSQIKMVLYAQLVLYLALRASWVGRRAGSRGDAQTGCQPRQEGELVSLRQHGLTEKWSGSSVGPGDPPGWTASKGIRQADDG